MIGLRRSGGFLPTALAGIGLAFTVAAAGCSDTEKSTELNPEGPPRVRQVFVQERYTITDDNGNMQTRIGPRLAFGSHPDLPDHSGTVTGAMADTSQKIRIVVDELLQGNFLEEIACADGTWSTVPVGATPDDIARCSGPNIAQTCQGEFAVCLTPNGPVGILDENEDGASDDTRMREGVATLTCDGTEIPLDRQLSFYQPSGNQQMPANSGINGLGPAIVLVPTNGLRTGAQCTIAFSNTIVDKNDNLAICAPEGGLITNDCTPGDTSRIAFTVEPLRVRGTNPPNGAMNVALVMGNTGNAQLVAQFNAALDPASAADSLVIETPSGVVTGLPDPTVSNDDRTILIQSFPGGYSPETEYTVTVVSGDNGIKDQFGGPLPQDYTWTFTTRAATPTPDAGPEEDAGLDAGTDAAADASADAL